MQLFFQLISESSSMFSRNYFDMETIVNAEVYEALPSELLLGLGLGSLDVSNRNQIQKTKFDSFIRVISDLQRIRARRVKLLLVKAEKCCLRSLK